MSIKRHIRHKIHNFKLSLRSNFLPAWVFSPFVRLGLFAVIFLFSAAYMLNITSSATSGYQMRVLEKQAAALEMDVKKLEVEIADNTSITSIASRLQKTEMTEASGVRFLASNNSTVAKK